MRWIIITLLFTASICNAATYYGNPGNYTSFLSDLNPGDTLFLSSGNYTQFLNIRSVVGTKQNPVVISGEPDGSSIFLGNACCNTVSILHSAHIIIEHLTIDGQNIKYIDAVKAEGHNNNWTHNIELRFLKIINHGNDQQTNGISTKCPSWNWHIHHNQIIGAGTGMYLGNSNGEEPFVNGLIEYNYVANTVGYNCQVKKQNDGSRDGFNIPDTNKTVIRYNVFTKAENASSGGSSRPNLLVGGVPEVGHGKFDFYEIYGNFFFQNPTEGLFQGTGSYAFYNNVLVNNKGGWGIAVQQHEGRSPRNIDIFHNTILVEGRKSISFYKPDATFTQRVIGNAMWAQGNVVGATIIDSNIEEPYSNAVNHLKNPLGNISMLDCSPEVGKLLGADITDPNLSKYELSDIDFEGLTRTWTRRGAYTSDGAVKWPLELDIRPTVQSGSTSTVIIEESTESTLLSNIVSGQLLFNSLRSDTPWRICSMSGKSIDTGKATKGQNTVRLNVPPGIYFFQQRGYKAETFIAY